MCRFILNLKRASNPNSGLDSLSNVTPPWPTISCNQGDQTSQSTLGGPKQVSIEDRSANRRPSTGRQDDIELANGSAQNSGLEGPES